MSTLARVIEARPVVRIAMGAERCGERLWGKKAKCARTPVAPAAAAGSAIGGNTSVQANQPPATTNADTVTCPVRSGA
jgi:hypothetical protein